ncbi:MAG TPA: glycosyltransferase family 9 protein [Candidatus Baltobacteraceae bacterium]|nr:glycosyltransferase family 9 protein [Candidatus Baltobacteraceae bacterium]
MTAADGRSRFLVISPQGLGDSLEATPLVRALRHAYPAAIIEVAVTRDGPRLLFESLAGYVDAVHYLPYWERGPAAFLLALARKRLQSRNYDASFLAYPSARPAYEVLSAGFASKKRYAHRHDPRMLFDLPFFRATLVPVRPVHNVERNRDLLRAAGIAPDTEHSYLVPPSWIRGERVPGRIAMHVGTIAHSELANRRWPLENFTELAKRLVHEHPEVTLIVGPAEREESGILAQAVPEIKTFEGPLPEVARFLSTCAAVVANDSGIAHLAAGVGARTIALFGPTPIDFGPFSPDAIALRPTDCPPCFDVRKPVVRCVRNLDYKCLKADLTVDLVEQTLRDAVTRAAAHTAAI